MKFFKLLLFFLMIVLFAANINAGIITMKDGRIISGKIIANKDKVTIRGEQGFFQFDKKDIKDISFDEGDEQRDKKKTDVKDATAIVKNPTAFIKTNMGEIIVKLLLDQAPITVNNFITLAKESFFNGNFFHRVIPNFMIQAGDSRARVKPTDKQFSVKQFADEINADALGLDKLLAHNAPFIPPQMKAQIPENVTVKQLYERQGYKYISDRPSTPVKKGTLASANAGPNTNSSQFFITVADCNWLDGKHTVFGEVVKGYDIVEKISKVKTVNDKPEENVVIESIDIIE